MKFRIHLTGLTCFATCLLAWSILVQTQQHASSLSALPRLSQISQGAWVGASDDIPDAKLSEPVRSSVLNVVRKMHNLVVRQAYLRQPLPLPTKTQFIPDERGTF